MAIFYCWHDGYEDDEWKEVDACDFDIAALEFFENEHERDWEIDEIERIVVRDKDGVTMQFRGYTEPSVAYYVSEIRKENKDA